MDVDIAKFLQDNIFIVAVAFVSGAMLVWPLVRTGAAGPAVNTLEATRLINREDAIVVDVRGADQFARGRVLGARNIPSDQIVARAGDLAKWKSRPVILVDENGSRSGAAASALRSQGFNGAVSLAGGVAAWVAAGLPTEKD